MTPQQALVEAADLVEKGWNQQSFARDSKGRPAHYTDSDAVAFCAFGAISRAVWEKKYDFKDPRRDATDLLLAVIGGASVVSWNDDPQRTQSEVVEALRKAAQLKLETNP